MSRARTWAKNGLLLGAAVCCALVLTEVLVRLVAPQPTGLSHQDRYGLPLHYPGITRYLPQYGHEVSFNSVGMRDREHSSGAAEGTYRVLLLGDSFMEALQVPFDSTMAALLEGTLQARSGKPVEVINAGVSGWGTDDELRYLTSYGLAYKPSLVVVAMTLHNDVSDNLRLSWHKMVDGALVEQVREPIPFLQYKELQAKAFVATRLQIYQLWRRVRHGGEIRQVGRRLNSHLLSLFAKESPAEIRDGVALTGLLLERMQAVAGAVGAPVVLVLLPIRYQLSEAEFADFAAGYGASTESLSIVQPQSMMTATAASLGLPVIDLLPAFQGWTAEGRGPLYLEWDGHWNAAGHKLAADVVASGLLREGRLP